MEIHIVVKGDTLWKIARQYGIPFEELKRANAHLAKSEYIVPGMKIFLPNKVQGGKQEQVKHPDKGKVPVKPNQPTAPQVPRPPVPTPKPPTVKPPTVKPMQPTPTPPAPTPTPKPPAPTPRPPAPTPRPPTPPTPIPMPPVPKPPVQVPPPLPLPTPSLPAPPAPMPVPQPVPVPMPPQIQMFPMQPCMHHPMIGIPCGWMPIFDADCHPFMHSGQIQAMPQPPASQQPAPLPLPTPSLPSTQFQMYEEEYEESPIFSSQGPAMLPQQMPMIEGWQLMESPDNLCEESPEWDLQPAAWCPPEQGYIPQLAPAMQQGFPMMPFQAPHQGCGCDGHHQHHPQQSMMMMPLFYGHLCNCQSSMQPTPYQMMPTPYQGSNWYGSY